MTAPGQAHAELLDRSNERDAYSGRIAQAWRDGWRAGQENGYRMGREGEAAEREQAWNRIVRPVTRGGQAHADLERTRWTVRSEQRTRETYGQPHPDDYNGREAAT